MKYDLIGKLVEETGLTRKAVIQILKGIQPSVFNQFKDNPEEFIIKAAGLINDEKATAIIEHITYDVMDDHYGTDVFTDPTIKGRLGVNAMKAKKHLYDHIVYDSTNEQRFATSGGSGMGKTNEKLAPSCKGAKLLEGRVLNPHAGIKELTEWAESLQI